MTEMILPLPENQTAETQHDMALLYLNIEKSQRQLDRLLRVTEFSVPYSNILRLTQ